MGTLCQEGRAGETRAREALLGLAAGCPWHGGTLGRGQELPLSPSWSPSEEEGEDEEEEKEEESLWICTDSGGNGSVSPGRFLI